MNLKKAGYIGVILLLLVSVISARAQEVMEKFGKNRLQYKSFNWRFYSTENFDIYFYDGGNEIAKIATDYLEKEFDKITDLLGTVSYTKTKILLYNSNVDLLQSNIGVNDNSFDVAGETKFVKAQVEIAYPGNAEDFKKELLYKVSSMLIDDMMFGGSLTDMFQNAYLLSLPEWFIDGAARYSAYGWSVEMDDYVHDLFRNEKVKNLSRFTGPQAGLLGQSIWNFIAERYGKSYISNILNLTRIIRNEERSISGTLGIPFKNFLTEWNNFYLQQTTFIDGNYILPDKDNIINHNRKNAFLNQAKISPEGKYIAYTTNNKGKTKVTLQRQNKNKEKTILKTGYKVIDQEVDNNIPLLSWRDEGTLGIVSARHGKYFLWIYDVSSGKKVKKELSRINQVEDFDIAKNGNLAVLSADRDGDNDLYLISLKKNSIKRITSDFYDDMNPRFVPGTSSIIFSSNRKTDSIHVQGQKIGDIDDVYNIFIYNIDSTKNTVYRITNSLSKNIKPIAVSPGEFYFLSDQQGLFNLYRYDLTKKVYNQVTNYGSSILDYDINYEQKTLLFTTLEKNRYRLYLNKDFDFRNNIFTAQTKRKELLNAKIVAERFNNRKSQVAKTSDKDSLTSGEKVKPSFLDEYRQNASSDSTLLDTRNYQFREAATTPSDTLEKKQEGGGEILDTDNYVFDTDVVKSSGNTGSFLSQFRKLKNESDVMGPFPYKTRFSADNIITSFVIDPLIGFGMKLETQMNDMLENHKFYGGVLTTTDLKSGSLYGEYRYLKHTVDFHARYDRKVIYRTEDPSAQKYVLNSWEVGAALPFGVSSRLSFSPFVANTHYYDLDYTSVIYPTNGPVVSGNTYGGAKVELIFDNTVVGGMNLIQGTRGKMGIKHYESFDDPSKSFSNFYLDFRNYQKIHRELVFATRLFYGRFFGQNKQKYMLGGVDNWIVSKTNDTGEGDPLSYEIGVDNSNILFTEYVTSLRGFKYNTFNGTNSLLFNAELRLPLIQYFYRGPISSNFFRNLLFIGFFDIGSAWTGPSPFATENSVNTQVLNPGGPFKAVIQNFKNPWLSSYGFGVRTMLLGYYVKMDVAYPVEDYRVGRAGYFFTLGYDF